MEHLIGGQKSAAVVIKDSNTQNFRADVIDASMQTPVIVDFWAPWCGPCKQLGPAIEKAVTEARGAVRLIKINVDQNQELAAQMRIQSIPAVYAFFQGRPVDGFVGAQPESAVKQFIARLTKLASGQQGPSPIDEALEQAEAAMKEGDHGAASAIYAQILQHEPENAKAFGGLIRCTVAVGELEQARDFLAKVPPAIANDPAIVSARAQVEVAQSGQKALGQAHALRARIEANGRDFEARFELARALFAGGEREAAADQLLEIFRLDRNWNDDAARKELLKLFEAMGPTDPVTLSARRQLSSLMFR